MNFNKFFDLAAANDISESEINFSKSTDFSFAIFKGQLINYSISISKGISARGIYHNKIGYGSTEKDDPTTASFLVDAIKDTAKFIESDDEAIIFRGAPKKDYHKKSVFSKALKEWPTEQKIALAHKIEEMTYAKDPRISDVEVTYQESDGEGKLLNSHGLSLSIKNNYFLLYTSIVIKDGNEVKSNGKMFIEADPSKFDINKYIDELVSEGLAKLHGETIKNGTYKAVLSQETVSSLLYALLSNASSLQIQKKSSLFIGKLNQEVASKKITVYEKPLSKNVFFKYFDDEGYPCSNKVVIDKGVLKTYFYNLVTAKKDGVESTGNAQANGSKMGITFGNIVLKAGRSSLDDLFKTIGNGVYVIDISGLHAGLDKTSGDFSLQAEGFHIKDGKKDKPLTLFTLGGNIFKLFNDVIKVGSDAKFLNNGATIPSVAFKNLKISAE